MSHTRMPVAFPPLNSIFPPSGTTVDSSIPASLIATELTRIMCTSMRYSSTGLLGLTISIQSAQGRLPPQCASSQPCPRTHPPAGVSPAELKLVLRTLLFALTFQHALLLLVSDCTHESSTARLYSILPGMPITVHNASMLASDTDLQQRMCGSCLHGGD